MITEIFISTIVMFVGAIFSGADPITVLPTIAGVNIDAILVQGMGQVNAFFTTFWPMAIMFQGFLVITGYFVIKRLLNIALGSRFPG